MHAFYGISVLLGAGSAVFYLGSAVATESRLHWSWTADVADIGRTYGTNLFDDWGTPENSWNTHLVRGGVAPDGTPALEILSQKDSHSGPNITFRQVENIDHIVAEYRVFLASDYDLPDVNHLKLNAVWGGNSDTTKAGEEVPPDRAQVRSALSESGWELYSYHWNKEGNGKYGEITGSEAFPDLGAWVKVGIELKVESDGSADGYMKLYINDVLAAENYDVDFFGNDGHGFDGFVLSTYHGGAHLDDRPEQDQSLWMTDFKLYEVVEAEAELGFEADPDYRMGAEGHENRANN